MKIAYVLAEPELNGGNKVVFQHAQLLFLQGHDVTVVASGQRPDWVRFDGSYFDYSATAPDIGRQDLMIATYYTTVEVAELMNLGPVVHFCQGYEGEFLHLSSEWKRIENIYSRHSPMLTVSPHLTELMEKRFGRQARTVSPPLDPAFHPALRMGPRRSPKIFIPGIFQAEMKGVKTALEAVRLLKAAGRPCFVVRSSVIPFVEEERETLTADLYLCRVTPKVIARALRDCDLMLMPATASEGFGLPLIEAMASKVPIVASEIPSVRHIDEDLVTVTPGDAHGFASRASQLLDDVNLWRKARRQGYTAVEKFRPEKVSRQLALAMQWASECVARAQR